METNTLDKHIDNMREFLLAKKDLYIKEMDKSNLSEKAQRESLMVIFQFIDLICGKKEESTREI